MHHPAGPWAHPFEPTYRATVGPITAYFARRTRDPQLTADLTADTFAAALTSFATYRPALGSARQWVFGIARRTYAQHLDVERRQHDAVERLSWRRTLQRDEIAEVGERIDAEGPGRALLERLAHRPLAEREVAELVLLADLTPREAAAVLGITAGAVRVRLLRVRRALRGEPPAAAGTPPPPPPGDRSASDPSTTGRTPR